VSFGNFAFKSWDKIFCELFMNFHRPKTLSKWKIVWHFRKISHKTSQFPDILHKLLTKTKIHSWFS
jgi:hypothetical protein